MNLPKKRPPFDLKGEQQIYHAVVKEGERVVDVAHECRCSVGLVYKIVERVKVRMTAAQVDGPQTDPGDEQ